MQIVRTCNTLVSKMASLPALARQDRLISQYVLTLRSYHCIAMQMAIIPLVDVTGMIVLSEALQALLSKEQVTERLVIKS